MQQTLVDTGYAMEVSQGQSQMDIGYATEKFEVPTWIFEVAADCSAHGSHVLNFEGLGMVRQVPKDRCSCRTSLDDSPGVGSRACQSEGAWRC